LGDLILLPSDSNPVFKAELSATKRATWSAPIPLQDVKTVGRRLGGTVNDVLLTAMTGALRRYLGDRGQSLDDASLTAAVPVNLRPPGTEGELGNRIGFVYLALPVGIADPGDRLREIKRRMDHHKGSLEAPLGIIVVRALGMVPASVQDVLVNYLGTKATVLVTNVMGPRERLYLAGVPLEVLMFWLPPSGGVGVGVSILSYAGQVWLGVLTDQGLVPDPEAIIAGFQPEFDVLLTLAGEAGEPPSVRELLTRLDDTLTTLDTILDGDTGSAETPAEA
jgi:WS/DGAT/MGAT family acyltransferase